ncbi:MAG: ribonuclease R [Ignavibacteria bacterium]|nr:ribonuclease R [Ignavibacteria bacterium]
MNVKKIEQKVLTILRESNQSLRLNEISRKIGISSESSNYSALKKAVENLIASNLVQKISRRRYALVDYIKETLVVGKLKIVHGKGIVELNTQPKQTITIKRKNLFTGLDGDKVLVKLLGFKGNNRQYGEVIEIVARAEHKIVGTIEFDAGLYFLVPSDERYYLDFVIPPNKIKKAKHGSKVLARLLAWDDPNKSPFAEVIDVLGDSGDIASETERILFEFHLPKEFPPKVLTEAAQIKTRIPTSEIKRRLDLRDKLIITIDPIDAKDFDDAVSLEKLPNGNYLLGVHIADVSYYVKEKSEIDREAFRRGTSVYLADQAIPMLPEKLSTDLCSLKPNRVRLTFSVLMEFNSNYELERYEIAESVIKSRKRLDYDTVYKFLKSGKPPKNNIEELIIELNEFAQNLRKKRFSKGGINFETYEVRFIFDENKNPINTYLKESNLATQLIEECMLAANRTVTEHIQKLKIKHRLKTELPFIYRIHDKPDPEKIKGVIYFFKLMGIEAKNLISAKAINNFLKQFENRPEKAVVHQLLIRAMQKAIYSPENIGHYGLGFRFYTHFTSPIRRYPDLVVHRLLKLYSKKIPEERELSKIARIVEIASDQSTEREIVAMEAERESVRLMLTILANEHIGETFQGVVSGVASFGFFVTLERIYTEGLVHIRDLVDDYYIYDEKNLRLYGKRTGRTFKFGSKVTTRIVEVDIEKRKVWLKLVDLLS